MEAINLQKTKNILRRKSLYIVLAVSFALMMLFFPNETKFKYEYQRGRPWMYETLIAPIDFPILKTDAEISAEQEQLASEVVSYYVYDNSIYTTSVSDFAKMQSLESLPAEINKTIEDAIDKIYTNGILPDDKYAAINSASASASDYIIIQKNRRATEELLSSIYTVDKGIKYIKSELLAQYPLLNADSLLAAIQIQNYLVPNLVIDKVTTEAMHKEAIDYISPSKGMIYTGQLIVAEGETITAEIEQLLNSYKHEYELSLGSNGDVFQLFFAHAIITLIVLLLLFFNIYFVNVDVLKQFNKFSFFLVVALLNFLITVFARNVDPKLLYMVPYAVFALYMISFSSSRMTFPLYVVALMPLLIITEHGIELYVMNAFAGGIALVSFSFLNRGWLQFLNALIIFISLLLVYVAFRLLENTNTLDFTVLLYLFLNALFVVAAYPLVFLLEKIFGLVSGSTLRDLADTNNSLLQELARKAPGTFQHSLQVANLAERAVAAIGGDFLLVKVGAMYHDIGKINNPQCFIENAAPGVNYHAGLSPMESAKEIIKHVDDGVEIAKKHNLPQIVIDFITSHHAKSQTLYFYNQYCNQGGDPADLDDFSYHGTLPTAKEQVVVMMADAVEAASRSLKDYSAESISNLVDSITKQRLADSQLVQADISMKDINIVRAVFKKHLQEIYHARIAYPKRNK